MSKTKRSCGVLLPVASLPSKYGIGSFSKEAYAFVDFIAEAGQTYWQILPLGQTGYGDSPYQSFSTFAGNPYFIDLDELVDEKYLKEPEIAAAMVLAVRGAKVTDSAIDAIAATILGQDYPWEGLPSEVTDLILELRTHTAPLPMKIQWAVGGCGIDNPGYVNYEHIYYSRLPLLRRACAGSPYALRPEGVWAEKQYDPLRKEFAKFVKENEDWLPDYALYSAIKEENGGCCYIEWEEKLRTRDQAALDEAKVRLAEEIRVYEFEQFFFAKQYLALKSYANEKGIKIIGDIPIYVAFDSADTWSHPELFKLDEEGYPEVVAGCPPDAFSATGQLWGNPIYRWDYHKKTDYAWWMERLAHCFELYDVLRIDHFRGFDEYWEIPYGDETAERGKWVAGPGYDLFRVMKEKLGDRAIIAEDLGYLTPSVLELVKKTGYPGMKVLQFAFDPYGDSDYLPHNYLDTNCVVYTGTHDNETSRGWYGSTGEGERRFVSDYCGIKDESEAADAMIRAALMSTADTAVIPMQDYLNLGNEARINHPSTLGGGNWEWRIKKEQLTPELNGRMQRMAVTFRRLRKAEKPAAGEDSRDENAAETEE